MDISQKIKRSTDRPLTNAHSEECLDKLLPQSDDGTRESFVTSPYGTLPRQRHKGSKSTVPIYAEVHKPNWEADKTHAVSDSSKQAQQMRIYDEIGEPNGKKISKDKLLSSSEEDQKSFPSTTKVQKPKEEKQQVAATDVTVIPSESPPKRDQSPQVPPRTAESLKLDSPSPQVPPQTADSLRLDSPSPQIPSQTAESLRLHSTSPGFNENKAPVIAAYATVEARDVIIGPKPTHQELTSKLKDEVTRKLSKEEIAAKTKSLGRSLKPKNKPAPLPPQAVSVPQPIPRSRKKRLSRTYSAEVSSGDSDAEKITKAELHEQRNTPKKEPLYESVDDLDLNVAAKSPPKVAVSETQQGEFLFKNMEFISVGKPSDNNDDSDDSTDWDSGEEDEQEEQEVQHSNQNSISILLTSRNQQINSVVKFIT